MATGFLFHQTCAGRKNKGLGSRPLEGEPEMRKGSEEGFIPSRRLALGLRLRPELGTKRSHLKVGYQKISHAPGDVGIMANLWNGGKIRSSSG